MADRMTIQRAFGGGGLSSLTDLNARLIAQAVTTTEEEAAESENDILDVGGARPDDPDEDEDEDEVEVRGRFVTEDPLEYNRIKEWIETNVFGGTSQGQAGLINAFVNEWDVEYRRRQGWGPEENIGDGATLERLLEDDEFVNGASWLPVTGTNRLPPLFTTSMPAQRETELDPETGEPLEGEGVEGEEAAPQTWIATADTLTGVTFRTIEEVAQRASVDALKAYREITVRNPTSPVAQELRREAFGTVTGPPPPPRGPRFGVGDALLPEDREAAGGPIRPGGTLGPEAPGGVGMGGPMVVRESERPETREIPHFSEDELQRVINPPPETRGGGGGGGGRTRRTIEFDKDHLTSQVADLYNRWMLEPGEAPSSIVDGIVNRYIRDARSLWAGKGIQKDFDTFVRGELKKLPRYQTIYEHKLPDQSEEEFIGSFRQPIERLGLRGETTQRQTEAAVTSGGGPADQFRRVSRSREAQVANAGDLSQRLAQTLQGVGIG